MGWSMSRAPVAGVQDPGAEPVCLTLTCSRHSLLKELFAEFYSVSQHRLTAYTTYGSLVASGLESSAPTMDDLNATAQLIIDGTLLECWSWKDHPEFYSGEHGATGLNS